MKCEDIVGSLRRLADEIDAGEHDELWFIVAVLVDDEGRLTEVRGWGQCSPLEANGACAIAASDLTVGKADG
jgi:hypothetical protein